MFAVDLHTHTGFLAGQERRRHRLDAVNFRLLATAARGRGLDAVAVTNHDRASAPGSASGVVAIPGIKVSTSAGHVLVIGPDPPPRTKPGVLTPRETVALAHDQGCAAVIAHPWRNSGVRNSGASFDAVELHGDHPEYRGRTVDFGRDRDLPVVGGSGATHPGEVGRTFTRIDADSLTAEAVVEAIHEGRVEPVVNQGWFDRAIQVVSDRVDRHVRPV